MSHSGLKPFIGLGLDQRAPLGVARDTGLCRSVL
jgi:hypothetical protein